ncbi:vasorin b [Paramormyrops kingsleyae]|uniref:vasorin b n=1 Tax=Paramormyrops kingsleyae TaxID=1676925 RepID=UPI003B9779F1
MKLFLPVPLISFLLLLPPGTLEGACPQHCSCPTPTSIFCSRRRSSVMPRGLPSTISNLYVFQNGIEMLNQEDFLGLNSLEMLDLSQNRLTEVLDGTFSLLSSLHNLDLSSNQITHISQHSFSGLLLLERLYLHNNQIQNIHPAAFDKLDKLLELKLQGNQLVVLPPLYKSSLLLLDLSYNPIQPPDPTDLQTPNLETLKMAGLRLTGLSEELMAMLGNLHSLDISDNHLRAVPPAIWEAQGLTRLNLSRNPMGLLKAEDFQNLEMLQNLDISNLNLQGFPEGFAEFLPKLEVLTVAENPFNCQCSLAWFPSWLRGRELQLGRTQETRCHFPPLIAGKLLENLDHGSFGCPTTTTTTSTARRSTPQPQPLTTRPPTTHGIPPPPASDKPSTKTEIYVPPPVPASPSSAMDAEPGLYFCPSKICLNGGTCQLHQRGNLECICPRQTSGTYCEIIEDPPPPDISALEPDIIPREVTSTTILLDLHRYVELRPSISGVRLTYSNLSGPDRRPLHLNVPATYQEYTLRGLRPNCTYSVCASPLGDSSGRDSFCTEARTTGLMYFSPKARLHGTQLTTTLVPGLVALALGIVLAVVVGAVCYLRRRRAKEHADFSCEPLPLELEGVKADPDSGPLPQKQPEVTSTPPAVRSSLEYELPLMQAHCTANNNAAAFKPSYL